jgi:hypothetical protein
MLPRSAGGAPSPTIALLRLRRDRWIDSVFVLMVAAGAERGQPATVGALAAAEPLRPIPACSYPAELAEQRKVSPQGLVS